MKSDGGLRGKGYGLPRAPCALAMTEAERICVSFRDQSADWSWESVIPLHKGRGERIATASVRTGFAMTVFYKKCGTADAPVRPWAFLGCVMRRGEGTPPYIILYYVTLWCVGEGLQAAFRPSTGRGAPRPADGIFASYLFRSSKFSAVTMDWTLVHRGAKVLARSS